jgi:hypothetical protein
MTIRRKKIILEQKTGKLGVVDKTRVELLHCFDNVERNQPKKVILNVDV